MGITLVARTDEKSMVMLSWFEESVRLWCLPWPQTTGRCVGKNLRGQNVVWNREGGRGEGKQRVAPPQPTHA